MTAVPRKQPDPHPKITPEQSAALTMLFAAHFDGDPLRIEAAITHLRFLADIQGLPQRRSAA